MILSPTAYILYGLVILTLCMILHELGHWILLLGYGRKDVAITFKIKNRRPWLGVGEQRHYLDLSKGQKVKVYLAGIIAGFIPIAIATDIYGRFILIALPYLLCCKKDVELLLKQVKLQDPIK